MSKKSKKAKKLKKQLKKIRNGAYYPEEDTVSARAVVIFVGILAVVVAAGFYLWQVHSDAKVQSNVQASVTDLQEWSKLYPDMEVPTKIVTGISGLFGSLQYLNSPYDGTDHNENTPHSVHIYAEDGNTIAVQPGNSDGSYTICGFNPASMQFPSADSAVVYDSTTGATKSGVPCPLTLTREPLISMR